MDPRETAFAALHLAIATDFSIVLRFVKDGPCQKQEAGILILKQKTFDAIQALWIIMSIGRKQGCKRKHSRCHEKAADIQPVGRQHRIWCYLYLEAATS